MRKTPTPCPLVSTLTHAVCEVCITAVSSDPDVSVQIRTVSEPNPDLFFPPVWLFGLLMWRQMQFKVSSSDIPENSLWKLMQDSFEGLCRDLLDLINQV